MSRARLDVLLTERELAETREKAKRLIMAGQVWVDGRLATKPGNQVPVDCAIEVRGASLYVSRGGLKLERALEAFSVEVAGRVAVDVGASTGGFTDCLLQHGAAKVYAIDVGYGQLAWSLRQDPRVVVLERTNIRYLEGLPELVDLATVDASFISLTLVLPATLKLLRPEGQVVALVKPQFEAGKALVGKGGVVTDRRVHRQVLERLVAWSLERGLNVGGLVPSPLKGPAGNVEFLIWLRQGAHPQREPDALVEECLSELP